MAQLLTRADRIVKGTLGTGRSYLSDDQRQILTDYPLLSPVVLFDRGVAAARQPGVTEPISVTQLGGSIVLNGLRYTEIHETLDALKEGMVVMVLLERKAGRFVLVDQFLGAFDIAGGSMLPLGRKEFAQEYQGLSVAEAEQRILSAVRARP
jgi:hypothetical protein